MHKLIRIIKTLDSITELIGKSVSYFAVLMVLVTCYVVTSRYVFNSGSIAIQESINYLNAMLVFVTVGFTLKHNAHVRVDIIYGSASARYKNWVNFLGTAFLLIPVAIFILLSSWDYVMSSWAILEDSPEANGLPFVYLLKSIILLMCFMLLLQGIAELLRNLCLILSPDVSDIEIEEEESRAL